MKRYLKLIAPLAVVIFFAASASAQIFTGNTRNDNRYENGRYEDSRDLSRWFDIARIRVSNRDNYESIRLNRYRNVSQLLFKTEGAVNIRRVEVRYSNGRTEQLRMRSQTQNIRNRNGWNEDVVVTIPAQGRRVEVTEVRFWFNNNGNRSIFSSKPIISVYGR